MAVRLKPKFWFNQHVRCTNCTGLLNGEMVGRIRTNFRRYDSFYHDVKFDALVSMTGLEWNINNDREEPVIRVYDRMFIREDFLELLKIVVDK